LAIFEKFKSVEWIMNVGEPGWKKLHCQKSKTARLAPDRPAAYAYVEDGVLKSSLWKQRHRGNPARPLDTTAVCGFMGKSYAPMGFASAGKPYSTQPKERRRMRVFLSTLVTLLILGAGCDHDIAYSSALSGTAWRLTTWSTDSPDPLQFTITAAFDDSRISGTSAVNSYGGTYTATASGDFSVGELQTTLMAGSEDAMNAEHRYLELLSQARKYMVNGSTLTLYDGDNRTSLVFAKR